MLYRKLTDNEIASMKASGCTAGDWTQIEVSWGDNSYVDTIRNVSFSGKIRLGDSCLIENVESISATESGSTFGCGMEAAVMNEAGGREVVLSDKLTAQTAWIMAGTNPVSAILRNIFRDYTQGGKSDASHIGSHCVIRNCGELRDVHIGDCCKVEGASLLSNCTVLSDYISPSYIGRNVIARDFVMAEGSALVDATQIKNCFIGQSCHIGGGFSAENSVFFGNCHFEKGEACSIFAGPFTVSHHKSTLMIAGMFSFLNAGSAANQSNHMYKTGPIHCGILERGCSLASSSHILWPMRAGAFTLVMGHIASHPDSSALPFSYMIESGGTTYLYPGINLFKAGTSRNFRKWRERDGRKGVLRDIITLDQLNPYTVGGMYSGLKTLEKIAGNPVENGVYRYKGTAIKAKALADGIDYYSTGIYAYLDKFLSEDAIGGIHDCVSITSWVDAGGMVIPQSELEKIEEGILEGRLSTPEEINSAFASLNGLVSQMEKEWAGNLAKAFLGEENAAVAKEKCKSALARIEEAVRKDAEKDRQLADLL